MYSCEKYLRWNLPQGLLQGGSKSFADKQCVYQLPLSVSTINTPSKQFENIIWHLVCSWIYLISTAFGNILVSSVEYKPSGRTLKQVVKISPLVEFSGYPFPRFWVVHHNHHEIPECMFLTKRRNFHRDNLSWRQKPLPARSILTEAPTKSQSGAWMFVTITYCGCPMITII